MIQIIDCDQGSATWYAARLGLPTASEFSTILAKGKDGGDSVTRRAYMRKLAGEILTGEPMENYKNAYMERGQANEDDARQRYTFATDAEIVRVGFIRNGITGCSPDGLVGKSGMVEIKSAAPHVLIELLERDQFPPEHRAQCQGCLWVAEREWTDLVIDWRGLPTFIKRAYRDEEYIKTLKVGVTRFNDELQALVEKVRRYGT